MQKLGSSFALYNAKRACLLLFLCLLQFQLLLHPLHVLPQALKQYCNFWSERQSWPSASSYPPRLKPSESSHAIIGEDEMPTYLVIKLQSLHKTAKNVTQSA